VVITKSSLDSWVRVKEELEGELGVRDLVSILIVLGEVGETNVPNVRGSCLELNCYSFLSEALRWGDVVGEFIGEEVP